MGVCSIVPQVTAQEIEDVIVSYSNAKSDLEQLFALENNVYVIWRNNLPGNYDIYFAKSLNESLIFGDHLNLSNNTGDSAFPRMAIVAKNIYAVWYDYSPGQSDIFFAKSHDDRNSFKTVNLSSNEGASYNPWIAAYENNVYVAWNDDTPQLKILNITKPESSDISLGTFDILLASSHDAGSSFEVSNISHSQGNSWNPRIAANKDNVYVVWNEKIDSNNEIFFSTSNDGGKSFSESVNISRTGASSLDASIKVSGSNVYVIWQESSSGRSDIFFTKSDNNGLSFSEPTILSNGDKAELTRDTQMVVLENYLYVVWFDPSPSGGVFFVKSDDYGSTFSRPVNLSSSVPEAQFAQIAAFDKKLYVIWQDRRLGQSEVYLRASSDQGKSFGSITNLSNDKSESNLSILGPQIYATDENVYAIFEKINEYGSDLLLKRIQTKLQNGTLALQTINGAVDLQIGLDTKNIELGIPLTMTIKFLDPQSNIPLDNVNYTFSVEDSTGNTIIGPQNQVAKDGYGTQTVTFSETGPFTLIVNIESFGGTRPYEDTNSGLASAVITVVPEFPVGFIGVFVIALLGMIIFGKYKSNSLRQLHELN